jgi:ABC-type transport system involved in multi-copper enzyme maturation permease subunit
MSLSEERQRGSLDVLMATPLSTRTIVLGKWLSSFRLIPWLAVGPGILALALAVSPAISIPPLPYSSPRRPFSYYWRLHGDIPLNPGERLYACGVLVATILAHGAAITGLGLGLATWVRRQSRAIGMSVTLFATIALAWPMLARTLSGGASSPETIGLMAWSPLYVIAAIIEALAWRQPFARDLLMGAAVRAACVVVTSLIVLGVTIRTFDRCMGRMPERGRPGGTGPLKTVHSIPSRSPATGQRRTPPRR